VLRKRFAYLLLPVLLVLPAGCPDRERGEIAGTGFEKVYERGPLSLTESIDKTELTTAETLHLTLTALIEEGYRVAFPSFEEKLGEFTILDIRGEAPALADDGRMRSSQTWELEPFLAGDYEIPALDIRFYEKEKEDGAKTLRTGAQRITVTSVIGADDKPALKSISPPVELPPARWPWLVAAGVAALAIIILALSLWIWKRRQPETPAAPAVPPHLRAFERLDALLAEDLIGKGAIKLFHIRLSDILRRYLEERFGLHAPERTTEEFLIEAGRSTVLNAEQRDLLHDFLRYCDLVKFARHEPDREEIEELPPLCRRFITDLEAAHTPGPGQCREEAADAS
jgi:hypothetical protein